MRAAALPRPIAPFRARLQVPLYRNGYALVLSSGLTSALGLVYWVVAARLYSPAAVGVSAALISGMTLIANLAHFNLKSALNRFLPRAGTTTARFVVRSYVVALAASALGSLIFLAGLGIWAPRLEFLDASPALAIWFVASTMAWTIFVLQDNVLAGIRQATWVPVENLIYALAKIAALFAVAAVAPTLGVFAAWSAPLLLLVIPVNLLLFRRLIPRHVRITRGKEQTVPAWRVARYVAADYSAYLILTATMGALPLVVLGVLGAEASAFYFVSWSIAYALYLIGSGMGMSMIAEASLEPARLRARTRQTVIETARILVPAVAVVVVAAPIILELLGGAYARESVTLLRLLALSALPWTVFVTYTNVARVERRMGAVVGATAALCGLVLAFGLPLLGELGINGLGVAWLAAQSAVATAIGAGYLLRRSRFEWRELALRTLSNASTRTLHWQRRLGSVTALRSILEDLTRRRQGRSGWEVKRHLVTVNDVAVTEAGPPGASPAALVKRATSDRAERSLRIQRQTLLLLRRIPGLGNWARLVPKVLASGHAGGRPFVVEECMPGVTGDRLLRNPEGRGQLLVAAEAAIRPLHEGTRAVLRVNEALLREWVDVPLARLAGVATTRSRLVRADSALERVRSELRESLGGRRVATGRVHGDLCPGNLLTSPDGARVRGIVDWEQGRGCGLAQLDLLHLLITARMAVERRELGDVVARMLRDPDWRPSELPLARAVEQRDLSLAGCTRTLVLLTWLHHAAANVGKSPRYARGGVWIRRNVDPVLAAVLRGPLPAHAPAGATGVPRPGFTPRRRRPAERLAKARAAALPARLELAASFAALSAALGLWVVSLADIDPRAMTDLGLVSVLPPTYVAALLVLTASFALLVYGRHAHRTLLAAHLLALIAVLHATPTIVYGTLRYSWAWKHVGIVDYIQRHGSVATDADYLSVYHNWPGFFGLDGLLTELAGVGDTLQIAAWGPVFFNVLNLGAVIFLLSALTSDRRVIWLGSWLFFITNWVGQDYFSPQAFAFFLYLVVLGIVLRWLGKRGTPAESQGRARSAWMVGLVVALVAAIAVSHALTAVLVTVTLAGLVLFRVCRIRSLPLIAGALTVFWDLVFAADFVGKNAASIPEKIRLPWLTAESNLAEASRLSDGQALVAGVARGLVVALVVLAAAGVLRQLRGRSLNRPAAILALAPLPLFLTGDYDGELLFRIYMFAVPFLAFFAAHALLPPATRRRSGWVPAVAGTAVTSVVLGAFVVAYYGKEHQYYFTPSEVAAARYVYTHAPTGALLIDGTHNYPSLFKNYERFAYVTIADEPEASRARLLSEPVDVLSEWMSDRAHNGAFVIITRSQKTDVNELGAMPAGSLDRIERALASSPRFETVLRDRDAAVFALAGQPTRMVSR